MIVGDRIKTPRFGLVTIVDIMSPQEAKKLGFSEPTHYKDDPEYDIRGKLTGTNRMIFSAIYKGRRS